MITQTSAKHWLEVQMKKVLIAFLLIFATSHVYGYSNTQNDVIKCSALYLIASSTTSGIKNDETAMSYAGAQMAFEQIFADLGNGKLKNRDISIVKSKYMDWLGEAYDKKKRILYTVDTFCSNLGSIAITPLTSGDKKTYQSIIKNLPKWAADMKKIEKYDNSRKKWIDDIFAAWTAHGRLTPEKAKKNIRDSLVK